MVLECQVFGLGLCLETSSLVLGLGCINVSLDYIIDSDRGKIDPLNKS